MSTTTNTKKIISEIIELNLRHYKNNEKAFTPSSLRRLESRQSELLTGRYGYLKVQSIEHVTPLEIPMVIVTDTNGKEHTLCPFGQDCCGRKPKKNDEGILDDGPCNLYHLQFHNGNICPDGICCELLNHTTETTKLGKHFCPDDHYVGLRVAGENQSTHNGTENLEDKLVVGMLCTRFHRPHDPNAMPTRCDEKCGGIHYVIKLDGKEVIAHPEDDNGYIKFFGTDTKTKKHYDLSAGSNNIDHKLVYIKNTKPQIPPFMCSRCYYDCPNECKNNEGKCSHFILVNMIHRHYDEKEDKMVSLKVQLNMKMITQSEDPTDKKNPLLVDHDKLIDYPKTYERRKKANNPNLPYVGGDSYGGPLDRSDPQAGSVSVFLATGNNLFNEE